MKKLWIIFGMFFALNNAHAMEHPLADAIQGQHKNLREQRGFSYLTDVESVFNFNDEDDASAYCSWFMVYMIACYKHMNDSQRLKFSTAKLESHVITKMTEDGIVMCLQDFHVENEDGSRVVHPEAAALLGILKNIAAQIVPTSNRLEKEISAKTEQEKNKIIAYKMRDLFKPLEEHIIAQHEASKPKPHWASGWKGHLLTATVASAVTLGAVYGALKLSNMKLTPAAV